MKKIELHFHTRESSPCGVITASEGVNMLKKAGYEAIVITDHFSKEVLGDKKDNDWQVVKEKFLKGYIKAKEEAERIKDIKVFLGMEIRFCENNNDILVYGIDESFLDRYPWIFLESLEKLYDIAEKENLVLVQAHPYRNGCYLDNIQFLHGIEIYNGNPRHNSHNEKAFETAEKYNKIKTVGSDFHQKEDLGRAYGLLEKIPEDEKCLAKIIKQGQMKIDKSILEKLHI